jgi:hypothetical protein
MRDRRQAARDEEEQSIIEQALASERVQAHIAGERGGEDAENPEQAGEQDGAVAPDMEWLVGPERGHPRTLCGDVAGSRGRMM